MLTGVKETFAEDSSSVSGGIGGGLDGGEGLFVHHLPGEKKPLTSGSSQLQVNPLINTSGLDCILYIRVRAKVDLCSTVSFYRRIDKS